MTVLVSLLLTLTSITKKRKKPLCNSAWSLSIHIMDMRVSPRQFDSEHGTWLKRRPGKLSCKWGLRIDRYHGTHLTGTKLAPTRRRALRGCANERQGRVQVMCQAGTEI